MRNIIATILNDCPRQKRLSKDKKQAVIHAIDSFDGFIDLDVLTTWILFSGQIIQKIDDFKKKTFYNCVRLNDYQSADGYLDGLEILHESYVSLLPKYIKDKKTLLILDPPYVCTAQGAYRKAKYFGMIQFLDIMSIIRPPFIFFSSTRSEFPAYVDIIISKRLNGWEQLVNYKKTNCKIFC